MLGTRHLRSGLATQSPQSPGTMAHPSRGGAIRHVRESSLSHATSTAASSAKSRSRAGGVDEHVEGQAACSVGILGATHFTNDIYGSVLPAMLPAILPALGLTVGAGGILVGAYQIVSMVLQP